MKLFNGIKIYTNALKSDHRVDLAVDKDNIIIQHKVPKLNNIFSAENYATHKGIKLVNKLELNNILIIRNSLSALLALKNPSTKIKILQNIQTLLIQTKKNIKFMWIQSHTGIAGNEKAYKYPDLATKHILNPTIKRISTNYIKISIKNFFFKLAKSLKFSTYNKPTYKHQKNN